MACADRRARCGALPAREPLSSWSGGSARRVGSCTRAPGRCRPVPAPSHASALSFSHSGPARGDVTVTRREEPALGKRPLRVRQASSAPPPRARDRRAEPRERRRRSADACPALIRFTTRVLIQVPGRRRAASPDDRTMRQCLRLAGVAREFYARAIPLRPPRAGSPARCGRTGSSRSPRSVRLLHSGWSRNRRRLGPSPRRLLPPPES